ncbi:O-antigen ligase family protein [Rhizobium rhizogenes]|jgi:O-antigen ligase|uniref:O-antigen ligase family protein n=1 Tax=Rhizobium rhizogenes TaxID=359 RepID=UPI001573F461|nr:O-antigen ligase family protein [Rhizobium rhizogenes]NTG45715.1 O-antigen ligase family protein [Rhizobium rhizogenes]
MNVQVRAFKLARPSEKIWALLADALWLLVMSASLVESYAYRYAGALLVFLSLFRYARSTPRPSIDWRGWLCIAWGGYALLRYVLQFALQADHPIGDHEVLFLMPLTFPPLAFILFQCWPHLERLIAIHFGLALAILVLHLRLGAIFAGETVIPLIQHNQIHGAVCCGMLFIGAVFWLLYYLTEGADKRPMRFYASIVAPLIGALCLIGIYGAKSKGVWLSLVPVLPVLGFFVMRSLKLRIAAPAIICIAALLALGIYTVRDNLYRTAGPTITSTISMLKDASTKEQVGGAVAQTIDSAITPISMNERLQLWSNAWELFSAAPVFGWGSEWLELWPHTHYSHVQYTFMHNGYLEILIRYGLLGAAIFAAMLACFCCSVYRAAYLAIIPKHAMHAFFIILIFFSLTILSNSNNRLASGESLSILTAAFALACQLKIRLQEGKQPAPAQ